MGAEAICTVTFKRQRATGKALLETSEIIFRGLRGADTFRLKIPLASITKLDAKAGNLAITYPDGTATFDLGANANKWADKIRNPKSRADKFGIKPGQRIAVLNVKDRELMPELRARGATVSNGKLIKDADAIFIGAESLDALARLPDLVTAIKRDGCIWTITPKGKTGIRDTDIMTLAKTAGLVALKVVSFSDTHSANKFVIPRHLR